MKLYGIRVFVDDLEAARQFYGCTLGLPEAWRQEDAAAGFDIGGMLIIEKVETDADADDKALVGRFVGCSIHVDDIHATYDALVAKGVRFIEAPEQQTWGGTLAHFMDPSGNTLTLLGD